MDLPGADGLPDFGQVTVRAKPEVAPDAVAGLADARQVAGLGRRGEACARIRAVLSEHPGFLDAERFLQDLLVGTRADAWLKDRFDTRFAAGTSDPDALYLDARIESSRARQAQLFRTALESDPGHPWAQLGRAVTMERDGRVEEAVRAAWRTAAEAPWFAAPWLYLGVTAWSRGAPEAAERFLREAIARAPEDARGWTALAAACDDLGRRGDASRAAVGAVLRAPGDPVTLWTTGRLLERAAGPAELEAALAAVEPVRGTCGHPEAVEGFRGRMLVALGRFDEAERALVDARRLGAPVGETAVPLRRARIGAGRVRMAVDEYIAELPGDVLAPDDLRAPAWRELIAAASGDDTDRIARALAAVGWLDCVDLCRGVSPGGGTAPAGESPRPDPGFALPGVPPAGGRAAPADVRSATPRSSPCRHGFDAFLQDLGDYSRDLARGHKRGEKASLDTVLATIRKLAAAHDCGDAATDGLRVRSYALLGSFAMSADSDGAFRKLFEDRGLLLIVGQRSGQGAEVLLGRLVSDRRGIRATVLGEEIVYDERWIESEGLPEGLAGIRGGLAGLTLDRFVTLQLDIIRRGAPREDPDLPYLARAATDDRIRRALDTPSDVARRIETALAARGTLDRDALDAVLRHERVHVLDAQRLLPPLQHPFAALSFAISHGFSAASMERTLEARAGVGALVDSNEPRAALASLVAFLPAEDGDTPHVVGYHTAVAAAVDEILRDPASFPSIDVRWNVVQQFDRLTSSQIRDLGRRLVRRMD